MNWLAHLWLADRSATSCAGQLLGDQLKGRIGQWLELDARTRLGVRVHRYIDSAADAHALHTRLRRRFAPPLRRYAGIIVDIGCDYALANTWPLEAHRETLAEFSYRISRQVAWEWPDSKACGSPPDPQAMAGLLTSYATFEGMEKALHHVAGRLRRANPLAGPAIDALWQERQAFVETIGPLMADLAADVERQLANINHT